MKKCAILCIFILSILRLEAHSATAQEATTTPSPTDATNSIPILVNGTDLQTFSPITLSIKPFAHLPKSPIGKEMRDLIAVGKFVYFIQGPRDGSGVLDFGLSTVSRLNTTSQTIQVTCEGDTLVKFVMSPNKRRAILIQWSSKRAAVPNAAKLIDLQTGICEPIIGGEPDIFGLDTPAIDPHWIDDESYVAFSSNIDLYVVNAKLHFIREVLSTWAFAEITPVGRSHQILIKGHLKSVLSTNKSPAPTQFSVLDYDSLQTTALSLPLDTSVSHPLFSQNGQFFVYCMNTGICNLAEFNTS